MRFLASPLAPALVWTALSVEFTWLAVRHGNLLYWFCAGVIFDRSARCWNAYWRDRGSDS